MQLVGQTPAQERASRENLKKGNPAAYSGGPRWAAKPKAKPKTPDDTEPAEPGGGGRKRTFRAPAAKAKPAKRAAKRPAKRAPREPAASPPPAKSSPGFLGGLLEGLGS